MAQVGAGDYFNATERFQLEDAIRAAEQLTRFEFSVFVGRAEGDPRAFATQLHNTLVAPARSILILVDPEARALEIVTGGEVRRVLSDTEVEHTALAMQSSFAAGELLDGLLRGVTMLAEHSRAPRPLHFDSV